MSVDSDSTSATDSGTADELARQLGDAITETPEYRVFEETKEAVRVYNDLQAEGRSVGGLFHTTC
jgi:hypothetical protein